MEPIKELQYFLEAQIKLCDRALEDLISIDRNDMPAISNSIGYFEGIKTMCQRILYFIK